MTLDFLQDATDPLIRQSSNLVEIVGKRAASSPEHIVYRFINENQSIDALSFRELDFESRKIAATIQQYGKKGDRVLLLFQPGMNYIKGLFASFYSGCVAVPAYPPRRNRNINRLMAIIKDAEIDTCLLEESVYHYIQKNIHDFPELKKMNWIVQENCKLNADDYTDPQIQADDLIFLQYTSGSTGHPKGVMVSHANLLYNLEYIRQSFGFNPSTVGAHWLPMFHDMGLIGGLLLFAYIGTNNQSIPPVSFLKKPIAWLQLIDEYKATTGGAPNFAYDLCTERIDHDELKNLDISSMETLYCGSEPIRKETILNFMEKFRDAGASLKQFYPCYGLAEATLMVTGGFKDQEPIFIDVDAEKLSENVVKFLDGEHASSTSLVGCGHTWMQTGLRIVNPATAKPLAENEIGEIWVSGPGITKGYWNNPTETNKVFNNYLPDGSGPYLRTGDLGFLHNTELFVTGRIKELIIIRGRNFYPHDIEYVVQGAHPALRKNAGAAFHITKNQYEKLVIVQELNRQYLRDIPEKEIFEQILQHLHNEFDLQPYAIQLVKTNSIPTTSSGKIQRRLCRYGYLKKELQIVSGWQSSGKDSNPKQNLNTQVSEAAIIRWLVEWIKAHSADQPQYIDPQKPVTAYGIDSLAAVDLEAQISEHFGFQWHISSFMTDTSIQEIAREGVAIYEAQGSH